MKLPLLFPLSTPLARLHRLWGGLLLAALSYTPLAAQEGWDCADDICIEADSQVARSLSGSFTGGVGISPETQIDRFAALEQQRWLELRFEVLEPSLIEPFFVPSNPKPPSNWPKDLEIPDASVSILVSPDTETYSPLDPGDVVAPGSFVSVLIGQGTVVGEDGRVHFSPSDWTLTLASRRVLPQASVASSPLGISALIPSGAGIALGCENLGCGYEDTQPATGIDVAGEPDPDPKPDPSGAAPANRLIADELAREMQTELARVGCYTGAIDGLWGPGSRGSVAAFNAATGQTIDAQTPSPSALVAVARQSTVVCATE